MHSILVGLLALAADGEWTRFRGPDGNGVSPATTIPASWTEGDYRWTIDLPGEGHASPVVWGEKVFVLCSDASTAARLVVCIKAADGAIAWQRRFESQRHRLNRDNSYAASTPAVDGERVYVYWTTPDEVTLLALDHDGKDVWRRQLGGYTSLHGSGASPILVDDLLLVGNDQEGTSSLLAVDRKTGETRWELKRRTTRAAYSTPSLYRPAAGPAEVIFASTSHGLTSIEPRTGAVNWEHADAFPERVCSSPVVADGLILGTCGEGGVGRRLVAVRPGAKERPPALVYEQKRDIPYVPTPLAKDGLVFLLADNGLARCLRAATGDEVWRERLGARFYGSFVWVNGRLYAMSREGDLFVLAAAEKFELLGRIPLGQGSHATPAVAGGTMYLRTFSRLRAIGTPRQQSP